MRFEKDYFESLRYREREQLVKNHAIEVLEWASRTAKLNLRDGRGKTCLDVGCAYGFGIEALRSLGYNCYGTDISEHSLLIARKIDPSAHLVASDVQLGLPFTDCCFDLVTCFEVLEHLSDPVSAIKRMYYSARSIMVFTTPNRVVDKPVKTIVRDFDRTHISLKTAREWEATLRHTFTTHAEIKVETYVDASFKVGQKQLFWGSFRMPYLGLDTRILIRRDG